MNLPVRSDCFIPSSNSVISPTLVIVVFLLAETNESIAVREGRECARAVVASPKPASPIRHSAIVTYKEVVSLILVKVCDLVDSALYHIKKLPRRNAFALGDLRDLEQSLLAKVVKIASIVVLLRRIRHRGDSERKIQRAVLVIDEPFQSVGA